MNQKTSSDSTKNILAFACIAVSLIGLVLGIKMPTPFADTFSPGSLLSFICFLLSLAAVKDRGNNLPAILAFCISFIAMSVSIFCSGMAS